MTTTTKTLSAARLAIIAFAVAACLALCCALPAPAHAADLQTAQAASDTTLSTQATVHKIKTAAQWHKIGNYKGGTFKLTKNITLSKLSQYLSVSKNYKYVIDLNGHTVKTTYSGKAYKKRSAPLEVSKGKVYVKDSSKKKKGVLRSTEAAAVVTSGSARFCLMSGTINDDFLDTQNTASSAIIASGSSRLYLKGGSVLGKIHGVSASGTTKVYTYGAGTKTYPFVRGEIGCGLLIGSDTATLSLKGGSFGTLASPSAYTSAWFPVLAYGSVLKSPASGLKYLDANKKAVSVSTTLYGMAKCLTTTAKASTGYYTVYVTK